MDPASVADALITTIRARRSIKRFTGRSVTREELERLLDLAAHAPNHRMTQPWRFYVLGSAAQAAYAALRAELKAAKVSDPAGAALVHAKVERETRSIPQVVAFSVVDSGDPELWLEDHAATFMGIENLLIGAQAMGLGGFIHTGRILERPELRGLLGVPEGERIVAVVDLGEPAEVPAAKARIAASERTTWLD